MCWECSLDLEPEAKACSPISQHSENCRQSWALYVKRDVEPGEHSGNTTPTMREIHTRLTIKTVHCLGCLGGPADARMLGTHGPREGGIPAWPGSGKKPTRKAAYGLVGMVSQSSVAKPAELIITNGAQVCRGTGASDLRCLDGSQNCLARPGGWPSLATNSLSCLPTCSKQMTMWNAHCHDVTRDK